MINIIIIRIIIIINNIEIILKLIYFITKHQNNTKSGRHNISLEIQSLKLLYYAEKTTATWFANVKRSERGLWLWNCTVSRIWSR